MRAHSAIVILAITACVSASPETLRGALEGPGGARVTFAAETPLSAKASLVQATTTEPPLPRDLLARSSPYAFDPPGALENAEFEVSIPTDEAGAEIYASDGATWARVSTSSSGGILRGTVRGARSFLVASARPLVWHEVVAPSGGLTSFAFSGHRIYAMSPTRGAVVSTDQGESWTALSSADVPPREVAAVPAVHFSHPPGLGKNAEICALAAAGERLFAALDDGTIRFSEDEGLSWHDYSGGLPTGAPARPTVLASDGSTLFASVGGRTFKARAP